MVGLNFINNAGLCQNFNKDVIMAKMSPTTTWENPPVKLPTKLPTCVVIQLQNIMDNFSHNNVLTLLTKFKLSA